MIINSLPGFGGLPGPLFLGFSGKILESSEGLDSEFIIKHFILKQNNFNLTITCIIKIYIMYYLR